MVRDISVLPTREGSQSIKGPKKTTLKKDATEATHEDCLLDFFHRSIFLHLVNLPRRFGPDLYFSLVSITKIQRYSAHHPLYS